MDRFPRMLYRAPGEHLLHGEKVDYCIVVDLKALELAQGDGWHATPAAAQVALAEQGETTLNTPPTRAELEQQAADLSIKFDRRTGDKRLFALIDAAMKGDAVSWTKRQIVEEAFGELALASYDFDLTPDELQAALRRLDAQMGMWNGVGIALGYTFGLTPADSDLDQDSGIPLYAVEAVYLGLACRLAGSKGKAIPDSTRANAKTAYDAMLRSIALDATQEQQLSAGIPMGAGNRGGRVFSRRPINDPQSSDESGTPFLGT